MGDILQRKNAQCSWSICFRLLGYCHLFGKWYLPISFFLSRNNFMLRLTNIFFSGRHCYIAPTFPNDFGAQIQFDHVLQFSILYFWFWLGSFWYYGWLHLYQYRIRMVGWPVVSRLFLCFRPFLFFSLHISFTSKVLYNNNKLQWYVTRTNTIIFLDLNRTWIVMAARPVVSVYGANGAATGETINMPAVFKEMISNVYSIFLPSP